MNWIDKLLLPIAPGWVADRLKSRAQALLIDGHVRRYEGAAKGRRFDSFLQSNQSADKEIGRDIKALRERSRYLFKNTPHSKRAVRVIANNVVGTGILPAPKTGNTKFLEQVKKYWQLWGEKKVCDFDGLRNFYGLQKLVVKNVMLSGECFVLKRRVKVDVSPIGLQLQVVEADLLDESKSEEKTAAGGFILNGIEYDAEGKRKAYWLYSRHPSEAATESRPIPMADILHVFDADRAGQHRSVPASASTMLKENDMSDFEDAELFGKKVAAAHAGFIVTNDPAKMEDPGDGEYDAPDRLEPGMMYKLFPGEDVRFNSPPLSNNYDSFLRTHRQAIAAGYGITYEQLTGDYSNVNFSSGRMGWIEFQRNVDDWQWMMMIPLFCEEAYNWFLQSVMVLSSTQALPEDLTVTWTPPRREMIDPTKEIAAIKDGLRTGLFSWQEVVRELGYFPEEILRQISEDYKRFKDAGLSAEWNAGLAPVPAPAGQQGTPDKKVE